MKTMKKAISKLNTPGSITLAFIMCLPTTTLPMLTTMKNWYATSPQDTEKHLTKTLLLIVKNNDINTSPTEKYTFESTLKALTQTTSSPESLLEDTVQIVEQSTSELEPQPSNREFKHKTLKDLMTIKKTSKRTLQSLKEEEIINTGDHHWYRLQKGCFNLLGGFMALGTAYNLARSTEANQFDKLTQIPLCLVGAAYCLWDISILKTGWNYKRLLEERIKMLEDYHASLRDVIQKNCVTATLEPS